MQDITLEALLEAGSHFGHKAERWHPKAASFIYMKKDGIHIIDLAKTKAGLEAAVEYIRGLAAVGLEVLFVGTKRQASGIVKTEAAAVGAPYFSERWIGGFLTNWDQIKKNIEKINKMDTDRASGAWKKFPKHEQVKMGRYLDRLKVYYGGVLNITGVPATLVIVDIKKEIAAVREAKRRELPIVGMVDTNSDPTGIQYMIPANDDAVGSIEYIIHVLASAYGEGKALYAKEAKKVADAQAAKAAEAKAIAEKAAAAKPAEVKKPADAKPMAGKMEAKPEEKPKAEVKKESKSEKGEKKS